MYLFVFGVSCCSFVVSGFHNTMKNLNSGLEQYLILSQYKTAHGGTAVMIRSYDRELWTSPV